MFLFTLEFWFWTAVIVVGAIVILNILASEAFQNFFAIAIGLGAVGGMVAGGVWLVETYGIGDLAKVAGIILIVLTLAGLLLFSASLGPRKYVGRRKSSK